VCASQQCFPYVYRRRCSPTNVIPSPPTHFTENSFRRTSKKFTPSSECSHAARVLRFGIFQDGDVGVGVSPEREEILLGGERADAGGVGIGSLRHFSR
jgi:hypothetical protein